MIFSKPQFLLKKNEKLEISSKYEDRWKKQKKDIYDLIVWGLDMPEENQNEEKLDLTNLHLNASQMRTFWEQFEKEKYKRGRLFFKL